jgi:hypothetical protein
MKKDLYEKIQVIRDEHPLIANVLLIFMSELNEIDKRLKQLEQDKENQGRANRVGNPNRR